MNQENATGSWSITSLCRQGSVHRAEQLSCQDAVAQCEKNGVTAIALADGASQSEWGGQGAQLTAQTLTELLTESFNELYMMSQEDLQYLLIIFIRKRLYALCRRETISIQEVRSTFLAAAEKDGCLLLLHLGDGWIAGEQAGKFFVLSEPMNGVYKNQTVLTSSADAAGVIRIKRGMLGELRRLVLLSDGWTDSSGIKMQTVQRVLHSNRTTRKYEDDVSVISMCRK